VQARDECATKGAKSRIWLETSGAEGERRLELGARALRLGGAGSDLHLDAPAGAWLEVGGSPPRLLHHGAGALPRVNGREVRELALVHGDRIEWAGALLVVRSADPAAALEALPAQEAGATQLDVVVAARLQAGLLCELGLVERTAARRWQDAVLANAFDPDAATRDLLAAAQASSGDVRLRERSARLLRDLLMAPLQRGARGAGRRVRQATRSMVAALVAQVAVLVTLLGIATIALLVIRMRWDFSVDAWLDSVIDLLP